MKHQIFFADQDKYQILDLKREAYCKYNGENTHQMYQFEGLDVVNLGESYRNIVFHNFGTHFLVQFCLIQFDFGGNYLHIGHLGWIFYPN